MTALEAVEKLGAAETFWTELEPLEEGVSTAAPCVMGRWWHGWASTPSCNSGVIPALKPSFVVGVTSGCAGESALCTPAPACPWPPLSPSLVCFSTTCSLIFRCIFAQSCHLLIDAFLDLYILNGSWSPTFSCHCSCISFLSCLYDNSVYIILHVFILWLSLLPLPRPPGKCKK